MEVGYPYLLMPDHVPVATNDPGDRSHLHTATVNSRPASGCGPNGVTLRCPTEGPRSLGGTGCLIRHPRCGLCARSGSTPLRPGARELRPQLS
jgi:hypothetical protein